MEFFTLESFELAVERLRKKDQLSYFEAILELFEAYSIPEEDAALYLSPLLKMKLENELLKTRQIRQTKFQSDFETIFT